MSQQKKWKLTNKFVLVSAIALVVLIAVCTILYFQQNKEDNKSGYTLTIVKDEEQIMSFTMEQLKQMDSVDKKVSIPSTSKEAVEGTFTGVPLQDILNKADKNLLKKCDRVIAVAGDGYSSALSKEEVVQRDNIIVAYACDEIPLSHFDDGGMGPLRLVISDDAYGNRSIQYLVKISCK